MKNLLVGILSLALIGVLTYFCFENKSETIKHQLLQKADTQYQAEGMQWVKTDLQGQDVSMKRIITLNGTAPSQKMKDKAQEIALAVEGIAGVENHLKLQPISTDNKEILTQEVLKKSSITKTITPAPDELNISKENLQGDLQSTPDVNVKEDTTTEKIVTKTQKPSVPETREETTVPISCQKSFTTVMKDHKIHFNYNKATINKNSYELMDKIIAISKECPSETIIIGGHTDSIGSYGYNKVLSQKRANAIKRYMVKNGIEAERLQAIGYGERKPITSNMEKAGRAKNRRIEFTIKGVEK